MKNFKIIIFEYFPLCNESFKALYTVSIAVEHKIKHKIKQSAFQVKSVSIKELIKEKKIDFEDSLENKLIHHQKKKTNIANNLLRVSN